MESLAMRHIVSIDLGYHVDPDGDDRDNCSVERSRFVYVDGTGKLAQGEVVDIHLACQLSLAQRGSSGGRGPRRYPRPETRNGMPRAIWNGVVIAQSDDTVIVDGNHYFPRSSVRADVLRPSDTHTTCGWKGVASYHHIEVDGARNEEAAWYYPDPKPAAKQVKDRIAFWRGVQIVP